MPKKTRREFLEQTLAAALASPLIVPLAAREASAQPADKLRVACIGVRGRGDYHVKTFLKMKDVEVVAICDIDPGVIGDAMKAVEKKEGKPPRFYKDARKLYEDKTIDAVSIATCNHTHTLLGYWAVQAGKHAYIEKPISHNVWEGRRLAEAAQKSGRIVAHGTQSRSKKGPMEALAFLHSGALGEVKIARGLCYKRRKSIGHTPDAKVPEGVAYDLWLGPAPTRAFSKNRFHYNWHWHWDYGNGDIGNQGVHQMDIARWGLRKTELPRRIMSVGGRFGYEDDGETANTQIGVLDYGDTQIIFEVRGLKTKGYRGGKNQIGNIFHCTGGDLVIGNGGAFAAVDQQGKVMREFKGGSDFDHIRNFVNAVRAGDAALLNANALDGHLSSALCHLPNISHRLGAPQSFQGSEPFGANEAANETFADLRAHLDKRDVDLAKATYTLGRALELDPRTERFVAGGAEANALLTRDYRAPFIVAARM